MKFEKILLMVFCILSLCTKLVYSAFDYTAQGGARALGMGSAIVAVENDGQGIVINPATVFNVKGSATIMYSPLFIGLDDGKFNNGFVNLVYAFNKIGIFSLNWEFLKTSVNGISDLYNEDKVVLTYSRKMKTDLYAGLRINYYHWGSAKQTDVFGNSESLGSSIFSFGLGAYYKQREDFCIGLFINNINMPRIDDSSKGKNDLERMPIEVEPGLSFIIKKVLIALDVKFIQENIDIKVGAEYWFLLNNTKFFGARLGMVFPELGHGVNATAGFSIYVIRNLSFDYGFLIPITTIKSIWGEHRFSISYKW